MQRIGILMGEFGARMNRIRAAYEGFYILLSMCPNQKISSMNLHQMAGLSKELSMACCPNLPMNQLACEVPCGFP